MKACPTSCSLIYLAAAQFAPRVWFSDETLPVDIILLKILKTFETKLAYQVGIAFNLVSAQMARRAEIQKIGFCPRSKRSLNMLHGHQANCKHEKKNEGGMQSVCVLRFRYISRNLRWSKLVLTIQSFTIYLYYGSGM